MEYERIHKVQTGIISPSKLRMKLMGPHHQKKKDGSNSNSSRTSPSRLEDSEFVKNSLLAAQNGDFGEEVSNLELLQMKSDSVASDANQGDGNLLQLKEVGAKDTGDAGRFRMQLVSKGDTSNSSSVHPVRMCEDENLDYDSTSSFEFHKGERSLHHSVTRSFSRPMSSKWNDAEKWIMNKQNVQSNLSKKANMQNQVNRQSATNMVRVVPESTGFENKPSVKRVDFCQSASQTGSGKFAFASQGIGPISGQVHGASALIDLCPESKDLTEVDDTSLPCTKSVTDEAAAVPAIRSVSMRDMGTEMTPIPSQEPSRSATPVSATTPLRSPTSSIPSTPRRAEPAPTPTEQHSIGNSTQNLAENVKKDMSEQELKLKTRREIVALGVQLGKMNIAAWASKDEKDRSNSGNDIQDEDELAQIEYAKRAAAWEEAEKSKHAARFRREEIRIQAWESQQKARLEAEMRKIEAQIEQMKAQAQAKMVKKVAMARQKSEEKRAAAESNKNRQAEKTAAQAEYIRQTGRIPSSPFICCGWS
ncbi:Remorin family protein [Perilla frutescens var. hirtella]|uniref:Remorin family protein n=1 Tax=Perilla frutescens var. hirtella TaxID=608512 RepID=A0AAD4J2B4_PERFH|nr:Remorin family protein [Perilla frutescens var. hirtella]